MILVILRSLESRKSLVSPVPLQDNGRFAEGGVKQC
jgi:hypothetical protein